ncbi:hypothetical protein D9Q98_003920 [Chlorella vulgaris]|uniref:EGF-like domain-containing protein n=1 Tax=Chlorella vulgaris TaxID=3077 RepID=A0A9D4TR44_CHLVU|nr:hypothetical protein D9Q98_003920 [Chlorella vulgaris]
MCRCPFGRLGDGCELDFLAPCKQRPDGIPSCGGEVTKSCECIQRCRLYVCGNKDFCGKGRMFSSNRGCYMRDGVPPDEQFSLIPEANETGVKYFEGYADSAKEVPRDEALFDKSSKTKSEPLNKCSDNCSGKGYCASWNKQTYSCRCYRGYAGSMCELEAPSCFLNCSGRGKCIDHFCHCKPPYFSIGCSRSTVYPKNNPSRPSPVGFKIYMYELNTQLAYELAYFVGWRAHDPIYIAYQKFMAQFLLSSVRTEDPLEASLFYVPAFMFSYSSNGGSGREHAKPLFDYIQRTWPYWNRTGGRDHFVWTPADHGACGWDASLSQLIRVSHFGMHTTHTTFFKDFGHRGHPDYGCYHPLKDVVAVPYDPKMVTFLANTQNATLEERFRNKKKLFFFSGAVRDDPAYAGSTRRVLDDLLRSWNDSEVNWSEAPAANYHLAFQEAKFCLAPYGYGWGMRLHQSILGGLPKAHSVLQPHATPQKRWCGASRSNPTGKSQQVSPQQKAERATLRQFGPEPYSNRCKFGWVDTVEQLRARTRLSLPCSALRGFCPAHCAGEAPPGGSANSHYVVLGQTGGDGRVQHLA